MDNLKLFPDYNDSIKQNWCFYDFGQFLYYYLDDSWGIIGEYEYPNSFKQTEYNPIVVDDDYLMTVFSVVPFFKKSRFIKKEEWNYFLGDCGG